MGRSHTRERYKSEGLCGCGETPTEGYRTCECCRVRAKVYANTKREQRKAECKAWRAKNPDRVKYHNAKRDPAKLRQIAKDYWRKKHPFPKPRPANYAYFEQRWEVINHYTNGTFSCSCCGEHRYEFLAIDHVNNNGAAHRKEVAEYYGVPKCSRSGTYMPKWIIEHNFPEGFQILCHNCNMAKQHWGECPHKEEQREAVA